MEGILFEKRNQDYLAQQLQKEVLPFLKNVTFRNLIFRR